MVFTHFNQYFITKIHDDVEIIVKKDLKGFRPVEFANEYTAPLYPQTFDRNHRGS